MTETLTILLAMLESRFWTLDQAKAWADGLLKRCQVPAHWLTQLSLSRSHEEAVTAVRNGMADYSIFLPDNYGEISAGFVRCRFLAGNTGAQEFRTELLDVFDAFDGVAGFQPEDVQDLGAPEGSQEWTRAKQLRDHLQQWADSCKEMQRCIEDPRLYERERDLIEL